MSITNLDKICAEYGMELLKEFSNIDLRNIKELLKPIAEKVYNYRDKNNREEFNGKVAEYSNDIKDSLIDIVDKELRNGNCKIYKYLLKTWFFGEFKYKLLEIKHIEEIKREKERIQKLIESCFKFEFSPSTFETEITKALGILVEDGPFAYMIWLKSQDKEPHRAMLIQSARILAQLKIAKNIDVNEDLKEKIEDEFLKLSGDLSTLLLAKTILEKMLIYARYKAKAMQHE